MVESEFVADRHAQLDSRNYPTGVQVSNAELAAVPITKHAFHGEWNYTISPSAELGRAPNGALLLA